MRLITLHHGIRMRHRVEGWVIRVLNPAPWQRYAHEVWEVLLTVTAQAEHGQPG